jgi:CRP-like cAMP-binding protein
MLEIFLKLGLPEPFAKVFADQFTIENLETGKFFLKEGGVCQKIGLVVKGKCRYYYNTQEGEVTRWISLSENFVVSLRSFVTQKPSVENIVAMEDTELAIITRANWLSLYEQHEFIREFWVRNIEQNYIGMEERVFNLIAKSAEERYEWMQQNQPRFIKEVPDKYLASMLGIHPRHLTRLRAIRK